MVLSALLVSCTIGGTDKPDEGSLVRVGDRVPEFKIIDWVDDTAIASKTLCSPTDFTDKKSLLVLFNRECGDCRREMPKIERAAADHPDLQVIAIERAAPNGENPYPLLRFFPDGDATIYHLFAEHTIPRVYFIDETATVHNLFTERLPSDFETQLENFIGI